MPNLFGLDANGSDDSHKQVFEKHCLDDLFRAAITQKYPSKEISEQESVIVHMRNVRVQGNKSYNVPAKVDGKKYEVDVLWCFPDMSSNFKDNLPPDTQAKLNVPTCCNPCSCMSGSVINAGFPYEPTVAGNFDTALVRLLAENSAYNVLHGISGKILNEFVVGAKGKTLLENKWSLSSPGGAAASDPFLATARDTLQKSRNCSGGTWRDFSAHITNKFTSNK